MKVRIKKYPTWLGPYQLVEKLCFWAKPEKDEYGIESKPQWVFDLGDRLAHSKAGALISRASSSWVRFHDARRIKVEIEPHDTWGMCDTLVPIILPMLKQLKETKQGAPNVDLKDVPKELQGKKLTQEQKDNGELDDKHFERWDWVLDEMIWAFSKLSEDNWEDEFYGELVDGSFINYNEEGIQKQRARIDNGLLLFGKYFQNLWD